MLLALSSAALFGGMTVAFRAGLEGLTAPAAALATILPALAVCLVAAAVRHDPLGATESLWGVVLSALLLRHSEGVGRRLALGAVLVVAGGAAIGAVAR